MTTNFSLILRRTQLGIVFCILAIISVVALLFGFKKAVYCFTFYIVLGMVFIGRAKISRLNWCRTVMATYEAAVDKDKSF